MVKCSQVFPPLGTSLMYLPWDPLIAVLPSKKVLKKMYLNSINCRRVVECLQESLKSRWTFPIRLGIIKLRCKHKLEDSTGPSAFNQRPAAVFTCIISMAWGCRHKWSLHTANIPGRCVLCCWLPFLLELRVQNLKLDVQGGNLVKQNLSFEKSLSAFSSCYDWSE